MESEETIAMPNNPENSTRKCNDLNGLYHKQDYLNFELHRRSFQRCMIQLHSVAKVKCWLPHVNIYRRCKCCNPEYYEFAVDLLRIKQGTLKRSKTTINLMDIEAFAGGRTLGCTRTNFIRGIPSTSSYNRSGVTVQYSVGNLDADDNGVRYSAPTFPPLNTLISSSSSGSSSSSSSSASSYIYLNTEDNWAHMPAPCLSMLSMTPSISCTKLDDEGHRSPTPPSIAEEISVDVTNARGSSSHSRSHFDNGKNAAPVALPRKKKKVSFNLSTAGGFSSCVDVNLIHGDNTAPVSISRSEEMVLLNLRNGSSSSEENNGILDQIQNTMELKSILKKSGADNISGALPLPLPRRRYVTFNLSDDASHPIQYSDETRPVFDVNKSAKKNKSKSNPIWAFAKRLFK